RLLAGPRGGVLRYAGHSEDYSGGRAGRLPLVGAHCGRRQEHAISDAEVRAMIITKKAIPRRTLLRGLGATLALPLLDGMVPALTALQNTPARPVNRFGVMYIVNGMIMDKWTPA